MAEGRTAHLHATVIRDGRWYVARCLEVEVTSQGETIESALANLQEALELYFEDEPSTRGSHCKPEYGPGSILRQTGLSAEAFRALL